MLISYFISTCLSHRTCKLPKSKMDSGISLLNFSSPPPPGLSHLSKYHHQPTQLFRPQIWCHPQFLLHLLSDAKGNPLANPVGSTSKVCHYLDTSLTFHCQLPGLSPQSILPGPPHFSPFSHWYFPTIHSSPGSQNDLLKMANLVTSLLA